MLKKKHSAWTPEDEAQLRQFAEQGVNIRHIALRLKRSESSIKKRARELAVQVKRTPRTRFSFSKLQRS